MPDRGTNLMSRMNKEESRSLPGLYIAFIMCGKVKYCLFRLLTNMSNQTKERADSALLDCIIRIK